MGRWEVVRWEVGEGGRVVKWQGEKGGKVVRWKSGECGRMMRQKAGRYLVLLKDGGHKMSPKFHLYVSDVNQGNEGVGWVQYFLAWPQERNDSILRSFASC